MFTIISAQKNAPIGDRGVRSKTILYLIARSKVPVGTLLRWQSMASIMCVTDRIPDSDGVPGCKQKMQHVRENRNDSLLPGAYC